MATYSIPTPSLSFVPGAHFFQVSTPGPYIERKYYLQNHLLEMTVFGYSSAGGFLAGRQVVPVDYETEVSQRLLEATHSNDLKSAFERLADPLVDVNYVGVVCLKVRKTELVCHDELPIEVRVEYEQFKTDVTALFLAVHAGNVVLVRKLLVMLFISALIF